MINVVALFSKTDLTGYTLVINSSKKVIIDKPSRKYRDYFEYRFRAEQIATREYFTSYSHFCHSILDRELNPVEGTHTTCFIDPDDHYGYYGDSGCTSPIDGYSVFGGTDQFVNYLIWPEWSPRVHKYWSSASDQKIMVFLCCLHRLNIYKDIRLLLVRYMAEDLI